MRQLILALLMIGPSLAGGAATGKDARGQIREVALCDPGCGPAIVAIDATDAVWVALARAGKLARYRDASVELFELGADSRPVGLAATADALWIAASYDNKILRFDLATHVVRAYPIDVPNSWPFFVAIGKDGAVWFSQRAGGKVSRLDPATGAFRHFDPPTPNAGPAGVAVDQQSGRVWFSESYGDRIASLDPATGEIVEYAMGESSTGLVSGPAGIVVDAQGVVWFAKLEGKLGRLSGPGGDIRLIDTPANAKRPAGVAVDHRGDVWIVALDGNALLRYDPKRERFTNYDLPTGAPDASPLNPPAARTSRPFGIAADRQGNIWFSEQYTGQLGVIDAAAPQVAILSPRPVVAGASTLVTAQALDRVSGVDTLTWSVDGRVVAPRGGRIDLAHLDPGAHTLQLEARDRAGNASQAQLAFTWAPGTAAIHELIGRLDLRHAALKAELGALASGLDGADARTALGALRTRFDADVASLSHDAGAQLRTVLDHVASTLADRIEVRILDTPPYFEPRVVEVRAGDTVEWKYTPATDVHRQAHHLHRIVIDALGVTSNIVRSGESFSYRFEREGQFAVHAGVKESPAAGLVKVTSRVTLTSQAKATSRAKVTSRATSR